MLDIIGFYQSAVKLFNMQYKALISSASSEMNQMEKIYRAGVISRIGFIVQEMQDEQSEINIAIDNRAIEINNNNTACLIEARQNLQTSVDVAGNVINNATSRLILDLEILYDSIFYPTIGTIEFLVSHFEVEIFMVFAYFNSVTSMFQVILTLDSEITTYGALFEYYVEELFIDMLVFQMFTEMSVEVVFPMLGNGLTAFRDSGDAIRSSLAYCS